MWAADALFLCGSWASCWLWNKMQSSYYQTFCIPAFGMQFLPCGCNKEWMILLAYDDYQESVRALTCVTRVAWRALTLCLAIHSFIHSFILPLAVLGRRVGRTINRRSPCRSVVHFPDFVFKLQSRTSMKWHCLSTLFLVFLFFCSRARSLQ